MISQPLISVVIPSYNRAEKLAITLESCLKQRYKNLEVIVVDDASTDHTNDIIQRFIPELNIKYFKHTENYGGAYARNTGIKNATGDFLTFLDSDDIYLENKIFSQMQFFQSNKCSENTILFSSVLLNNGLVELVYPEVQYNAHNYKNIFDYIFIDNGLVQTNTIFLKTSLAKKIMFDENLRIHQDYDFIMRAQNLNCNFTMMNESDVVWFCDKRDDRIGRISNFRSSYQWIRINKQYLSSYAYKKFILNHLLPQLRLKKFSYDSFKFLSQLLYREEINFFMFIKILPSLFFSKPSFLKKHGK